MWWLDDEVYDIMKNPECKKMRETLEKCKELNMLTDIKCNTISDLFKNFCKKDIKQKKISNDEN